MTNYEDLKDYHVFRWKSCMSLSVEHFKTILRDPKFRSDFDSEFAVRIGERSRELTRISIRFYFLFLPFVITLGAFESEFISDLTVFGISFSRDNATLGILLLISSIILIFSSAVSLISNYYSALLDSYVGVRHDEKVVKFYLHQFDWNLASVFDSVENNTSNISHSYFTSIFIIFWVASLFCAGIILETLILLIFVGATITTLDIPNLPDFVSLPIVVVAICAVVFKISCLLVQCPLPFTDYSNMERLKELEKADPDLADKIRANIATSGLHKDRRNSLFVQAIVLIVFIAGPTWIVIGNDLFKEYEIVLQVFIGLAILIVLISPLVHSVERSILIWVFQIEDKELSLRHYISTKKWMWRFRLIFAAGVGLGVFLSQ